MEFDIVRAIFASYWIFNLMTIQFNLLAKKKMMTTNFLFFLPLAVEAAFVYYFTLLSSFQINNWNNIKRLRIRESEKTQQQQQKILINFSRIDT